MENPFSIGVSEWVASVVGDDSGTLFALHGKAMQSVGILRLFAKRRDSTLQTAIELSLFSG